MVTFGSLFSGIGGFDVGFSRAGLECAWQVEIDETCKRVLRKRFSTDLYGDVKEINRSNVAAVDVICGGFPCQDLSVAGKRAGLDGDRSGLWFEFHRLLAELRPRFCVIENVPGLLSSNEGRDFAVILRGLVELGYGVAWRILDAQYFGVAQRRRRVFIVGSLGDGSCAEILFESESSSGYSPPSREAGTRVAACVDGSTYSDREAEHSRLVATGINGSGLRGRQPGSAASYVTVPAAAWALQERDAKGANSDTKDGRLIVAAHDTGQGWWNESDVSGTLRAEGDNRPSRPSNIIAVAAPLTAGMSATPGVNRPGRRREDDENLVVNCFNGYTGGPDDNDAQANHLVTHALRSEGADASEDGTGRGTPIVAMAFDAHNNVKLITGSLCGGESGGGKNEINLPCAVGAFGVRRLTPTECERLQGFEDGWTAGESDSARYRMLGNAVAVPVAQWIGERIMKEV